MRALQCSNRRSSSSSRHGRHRRHRATAATTTAQQSMHGPGLAWVHLRRVLGGQLRVWLELYTFDTPADASGHDRDHRLTCHSPSCLLGRAPPTA
jgi:hypothetical protein